MCDGRTDRRTDGFEIGKTTLQQCSAVKRYSRSSLRGKLRRYGAYNAHVGAVVAGGDKETLGRQVADLACDLQRGVLIQRFLRKLDLLVACGDGRAQLGQLRVYAEADRPKLSAADVHVVVVVVATFVRLIVRAIFGVGTCSRCSNVDVIKIKR